MTAASHFQSALVDRLPQLLFGDANDLVQAMGQQALRDCIASARWVAAREPTYPEPCHDVAEARAELARQVAEFMAAAAAYHDHLLAEPDDAEGTDTTPVPMRGLPVDVGLGKTSQVREQIIAALAAKRLGGGKVVFAVPRHDLGEEQVAAFAVASIAAVLWKGGTAPDPAPDNPDQRMCRDPDAQADALAAELSVEQVVCRVKRDSKISIARITKFAATSARRSSPNPRRSSSAPMTACSMPCPLG